MVRAQTILKRESVRDVIVVSTRVSIVGRVAVGVQVDSLRRSLRHRKVSNSLTAATLSLFLTIYSWRRPPSRFRTLRSILSLKLTMIHGKCLVITPVACCLCKTVLTNKGIVHFERSLRFDGVLTIMFVLE